MRSRVASQISQTTDVCIFCALRFTRQVPVQRDHLRLPRRAYNSSTANRRPAGAATAQKEEDDDDDFPLLRQNAGTGLRATSNNADRNSRLIPPSTSHQLQRDETQRTPSKQEYGFKIRRVNRAGSNDNNPQPEQNLNRDGNRAPKRNWSRDQNGDRSFQNDRERLSYNRSRFGLDDRSVDRTPRQDGQQNGRTPRSAPVNSQGDAEIPRFRIHRSSSPRNQDFLPSKPSSGQFSPIQSASQVNRDPTNNPRKREQPQTTPHSRDNRILAEIKKLRIPVHEKEPREENINVIGKRTKQGSRFQEEPENEAVEDQVTSRRSRVSRRFEVEDEVDLPPSLDARKSVRSTDRGYRNKSQAFDFEMYEAEQALNGEQNRRKKKAQKDKVVEQAKPTLTIPEFITVQQLAQSMKVKVDDLITKLEEEGFEGARFDHMLDAETSAMFADMYGFEPVAVEEETQDLSARPLPENLSNLPPRPPIVTIMGHVDHGKTTILDWLRKSSVAAGEHGGITQHIGAFSVKMPGSERQITFLDTPGHEAFLDMRRRGANVTDIVVLVVAADDSVKPQTVEAIKHALEARVQLIVAINKVDKHDANIEQVKSDLTRHDIVVEDYGGDYQAIAVSGKTGQGMEQLEEAIITLADVLDLRAEQDGPAEGQIIESKVTNAGRVATVLVRRGVLRIGDFIVAGPTWGRVRTLRKDTGQLVQEAYPGDPVQVDGWRGSDPTAGLEVLQADNEQHAKDVVEIRHERARQAQSVTDVAAINATKSQEAEARAKVLAWEAENAINPRRRRDNEGWIDAAASSGPKKVHFAIKADVAGSVEAIVAAVSAMGNHEIQANVIHSGTGPVTESDIRMLATTGEISYAISFNQPIDGAMYSLAEAAGLQILDHNIIYKVTDAVKEKLGDALPPLITQRVLGEAEVGKIFEVTIKKDKIKIAGCKITNGTISRANQVRVIRKGETIYTGTLDSLKNVKKDVTEMRKGTECGMGFKDWEDVQEGDQVQCFEEKAEKRSLY